MSRNASSTQKIGIARHDHIGAASHCQFQELVVLWITAAGHSLGNRHQLGSREESLKPDGI